MDGDRSRGFVRTGVGGSSDRAGEDLFQTGVGTRQYAARSLQAFAQRADKRKRGGRVPHPAGEVEHGLNFVGVVLRADQLAELP